MRKFLLWSPVLPFIGIIAALAVGELGWPGHSSASLQLTNRSGTEISNISVSLYQAACTIERLQAAHSAVCELAIKAEAHYTITWTEAGNGSFEERAGYVADGFDYSHELTFLGDGKIDFSPHASDY
jgi:hypothetical protein